MRTAAAIDPTSLIRWRGFALLPLVLASFLLLAACDGDDDADTDVGTIDETPPATETTENGENPTDTPTEDADGTATATDTPADGEGGDDPVALGEQLVTAQGCNSCHGAGIAPAFDDIPAEESLASGETVQVDAEYIRRSIVEPNAQIVEGYNEGIMPQTYGDQLSAEQIDALVQYILSLQ